MDGVRRAPDNQCEGGVNTDIKYQMQRRVYKVAGWFQKLMAHDAIDPESNKGEKLTVSSKGSGCGCLPWRWNAIPKGTRY